MRPDCRIPILVLFAFVGHSVGCGMQPIPEVAVEGTTVVVPIPGNYEVGYGTKTVSKQLPLSATASSTITSGELLVVGDTGLEDFQRGEMLVTLMKWDSTTSQFHEVVNLPVRYVAAVSADPGSERGRSEYPANNRQNALVLDIPFMMDAGSAACQSAPCSLVPDGGVAVDYHLKVRRFRRSVFTAGASTYVELKQSFFDSSENPGTSGDSEWHGWGKDAAGPESPASFIPIKIADSSVVESIESDPLHANHPQTKTQFEYWYASNPLSPGIGGILKSTISQASQGLPRPDPEFSIKVNSATSSLAAWNLSINYPANHITITDVRPIRTKSTGGFVGYSATPASPPACTNPTSGLLKITVADPEALTTGVVVSYRLSSGFAGCIPALGPLIPGNLTGIAVTGYDVNGVVVSNATFQTPTGPDFQDL